MLTFPSNTINPGNNQNLIIRTQSSGNAFTEMYQRLDSWEAYSVDDLTAANSAYAWIRAELPTLDTPQVFIENQKGSAGIPLRWTFDADGELTIPSGGRLGFAGKGWTGLDGGNGAPVSLTSLYPSGMYSGCITITPGNGAEISTYGDGTGQTGNWMFGNDGALQIQYIAKIATSSTVTCAPGVDTVVYTGTTQYQMTFKLLLKVEGIEDPNSTEDTQSTEMIVAKGTRNNAVAASVYGVVHTSVAPLATFTSRWNAITSRVEITCRPTSLTNSVTVIAFATEISTSH